MTEREKVVHLLLRAGFGATPAEVDRWTAAGRAALVEHLLTAPGALEAVAAPEWPKSYQPERLGDAQALWLHRMTVTRYPLVEKMTLFWHHHFATSARKGIGAVLMQRQNDLLRAHALGNFPALLRAIGQDGAMLIWLDGHGSTRKAPNENYAREVMELFTTGPGPYTEQDIQEAARAFTGWRVDKETLAVRFFPIAYDAGEKRFLGRIGKFTGEQIADLLSGRPETARFLAAKLWRFFASPTPDAATVDAMAAAYLASSGEVRPVLRALFTADAFYAESVQGTQVRWPAELVAATLRMLELPVTRDAAGIATRMGQALYDPPNVAGWPGGAAWLGATPLLARWNFGEAVKLWLGQKPRLLAGGVTPAELVDGLCAALGVIRPRPETRAALLGLIGPALPADARLRWELTRNLVRAIIASPDYQVQ